MNETEHKFYSELKEKNSITRNKVPKSIKASPRFKELMDTRIIDTEKSGRGSRILIGKPDSFNAFFSNSFPDEDVTEITKTSNIRKYRNSKARKTEASSIFFLRGFRNINVNNKAIDLKYFTQSFALFGIKQPLLYSDKICFVENLNSFMRAEEIFGEEYTYFHRYGRIGVQSLEGISAKDILVFVDYDFNGLAEYLRIKSVYENAVLYIPENFDELFKKYSRKMVGKQKQSKRVAESKLMDVVRIRELVSRSNRFLEQEILIND